MIVYVDNRAPTGRILYFSLSENTNGEVSMTLKKKKELKAPVFAAISYGQVRNSELLQRIPERGDADSTIDLEFPDL